MTDNEEIPVWALDKAAQAAHYSKYSKLLGERGEMMYALVGSVRAHAALISKHGQPPADPGLLEARECATLVYEDAGITRYSNGLRSGINDNFFSVQSVLLYIKREKEGEHV